MIKSFMITFSYRTDKGNIRSETYGFALPEHMVPAVKLSIGSMISGLFKAGASLVFKDLKDHENSNQDSPLDKSDDIHCGGSIH